MLQKNFKKQHNNKFDISVYQIKRIVIKYISSFAISVGFIIIGTSCINPSIGSSFIMTASAAVVQDGWDIVDGQAYWYEDGVKQGTEGRGKEIYDPATECWYWLDADNDGAKAVSKDVYMPYTVDGQDEIGKWVRYDEAGKMIKGWSKTETGLNYFDEITGAMVKGEAVVDDCVFTFDEDTGVAQNLNTGWIYSVDGTKAYWYENGVKQGTEGRGKEIYDPATDCWYWLDAVQRGAKASSKDVYMPYTIYGKDTVGKWVRYDENGQMIKGWQDTDEGRYYFDTISGSMGKDYVVIDKELYYFDLNTGIESSSQLGESFQTQAGIIRTAYEQLGVPYLWSGKTPSGFDCSGLIYYVFKQNGMTVNPPSSAMQSQGEKVEGLANALPGDIVCYSGHVAIYIGNGQIIHAPYEGEVVKIASVNIMKVVTIRRCW